MRPDAISQRGFSLPVAVFIITILALIGTAMVALTQSGQESTAAEVQSIRAFYAAESGAQIALTYVLPLVDSNSNNNRCNDIPPNLKSPKGLPFTTLGLEGCNASIETCIPHPQTGVGTKYYTLTSVGECQFGNSGNTARRRIEIMAKGP